MALIELPAIIQAGVTLDLRFTLTAYPPAEWSLAVGLRGPSVVNIAGVADGAAFVVGASAAATGAWAAGDYAWAARLTALADGEVIDAGTGTLAVIADILAGTEASDQRTHAQRVLAAIEAVIERRASKDQESYKIGNRELKRMSIADLLKLRDRYRAEVVREKRARSGSGGLFGQHVRVRF